MTQQTIHISTGRAVTTCSYVTQRVAVAALCLGAAIMVLSAAWPSPKPKTVANLTEQFTGQAHYWMPSGEPAGFLDHFTTRHFRTTSQIAAAQWLGDMGPAAVAAVPVLIDALENGPNDIDTGDGILPYRSTIAIALGKIGDTRAIDPLMEKLKVKEHATFPHGYSGGSLPGQPIGVGQQAIVVALGMFGAEAKPAIPLIRALDDADDFGLSDAVNQALDRIDHGES